MIISLEKTEINIHHRDLQAAYDKTRNKPQARGEEGSPNNEFLTDPHVAHFLDIEDSSIAFYGPVSHDFFLRLYEDGSLGGEVLKIIGEDCELVKYIKRQRVVFRP